MARNDCATVITNSYVFCPVVINGIMVHSAHVPGHIDHSHVLSADVDIPGARGMGMSRSRRVGLGRPAAVTVPIPGIASGVGVSGGTGVTRGTAAGMRKCTRF